MNEGAVKIIREKIRSIRKAMFQAQAGGDTEMHALLEAQVNILWELIDDLSGGRS